MNIINRLECDCGGGDHQTLDESAVRCADEGLNCYVWRMTSRKVLRGWLLSGIVRLLGRNISSFRAPSVRLLARTNAQLSIIFPPFRCVRLCHREFGLVSLWYVSPSWKMSAGEMWVEATNLIGWSVVTCAVKNSSPEPFALVGFEEVVRVFPGGESRLLYVSRKRG